MQRADKNIAELLDTLNGAFHQAKTSGQNCHLIYGTAGLDCYGCPSVSGYCCYSGRHGDTIHQNRRGKPAIIA